MTVIQLRGRSRVQTDGGLITSSAAVVDGKVYFGGGKTMYCLNAADGSLVWKKVICGNPDVANCEADDADPTRIFSSPAVFKRKVFFGFTPDGANGYRGGFMALDARSGVVRWRSHSPDRRARPGRRRGPRVVQRRARWAAAIGQPAFVTSTFAELTGTPARTFLEWATDHAAEFRASAAG